MTLTKFFSALLVLGMMTWSFHKARSPREVDFEVHAKLQTHLQELMEKRIRESQPNLTQLKFLKLWTKELPSPSENTKQRVLALVDFELITEHDEEAISSQQSLEVTLIRKEVSDGDQVWAIEKVEPKTQVLRFTEGEVVTLKGSPSPSETETVESLLAPPPAE